MRIMKAAAVIAAGSMLMGSSLASAAGPVGAQSTMAQPAAEQLSPSADSSDLRGRGGSWIVALLALLAIAAGIAAATSGHSRPKSP